MLLGASRQVAGQRAPLPWLRGSGAAAQLAAFAAPRRRETAREERKRGINREKELILQQIEGDKSERIDKSWR